MGGSSRGGGGSRFYLERHPSGLRKIRWPDRGREPGVGRGASHPNCFSATGNDVTVTGGRGVAGWGTRNRPSTDTIRPHQLML